MRTQFTTGDVLVNAFQDLNGEVHLLPDDHLMDFDYADDAVLPDDNPQTAQNSKNRLKTEDSRFGSLRLLGFP